MICTCISDDFDFLLISLFLNAKNMLNNSALLDYE